MRRRFSHYCLDIRVGLAFKAHLCHVYRSSGHRTCSICGLIAHFTGYGLNISAADASKACFTGVVLCPCKRWFSIAVPQFCSLPGLAGITSAAASGFLALLGACRCSGYCPLTEVMTKRIHIAVHKTLAANAGVSGIALFGAGRRGNFYAVIVTCCRDFFVSSVVAT